MDNTYNPCFTHCYRCNEAFKDGDRFIGYYEHFLHVECAPIYLVETGRQYTYPLVKSAS